MSSVLSNFYFPRDGVAWTAWDPDFHHRRKSQAESWEVIDIDAAAKKYRITPEIEKFLNHVITAEVYQDLIDPKSKEKLEKQGFVIIQNGSTRVVYHRNQPEWMIKVGLKESRNLPVEGPVKVANARKGDPKVWHSVHNTNLLRAAGREYFVGQMQDLDPEDRDFFDFAEEYMYQSPHAPDHAPTHQKYFAISKKKAIYSGEETVALIQDQEIAVQREITRKIVKFIKCTRFHDWHRDNMLLSKEVKRWRFDFIDNEPLGIFISSEDRGANLLDPHEQVLFGLIAFRDWYCRDNGLTVMAEEADQAIVDYLKQNQQVEEIVDVEENYFDPAPATDGQTARSVALIIASIICPPIFILLALIAFFQPECCPLDHPADRFESVNYAATPGRLAYGA